MAEVCLDNLTFREGIDLICLAIKLLFSSIQQPQNDAEGSQTDDKEKKTSKREHLKENYGRKLSEKLLSKLKRVLPFDMPNNYRNNALSRELEVRVLLDITVSIKTLLILKIVYKRSLVKSSKETMSFRQTALLSSTDKKV